MALREVAFQERRKTNERCGELEIALRTPSDTALNWLTSNAVITSEQRADAVAILQRISEWLERAAV